MNTTSRYIKNPIPSEPDIWTVRNEWSDTDHTVAVTEFFHIGGTADHVTVQVHPVPGQEPRPVTVTASAGEVGISVGGATLWLTLAEASTLAGLPWSVMP
jgi:hypothetical protein